jgi:hypothetical protein
VNPVVIRRSAMRMWKWSLAGVPFVVLGVDVLTRRRLTNALRDVLFRPDDTQIFEPRDVIWAWFMLGCGLVLVCVGLKELMFPTAVVEADTTGLRLRLSGLLRPPTSLSWAQIDDIGSGSVADEGDRLPVLWVRVFDPDDLPDQPWGARWIDESTVAVLTSDWDRSAVRAAEEITLLALEAARAESSHEDGEGAVR